MATQASGPGMEGSSALYGFADRGNDLMRGRRLTDQTFDDCRSGVAGDATDIAHRRRTACGDRLLGGGNAFVQPPFKPLVGRLRSGRLLLAGGVGDRLGAAPGVGERFFIRRMRRVRLLLEAVGPRN